MNAMTKSVDLVFEGGGVKGIGLGGAYSKLYEDGWRPKRVAGTSAGAITAAAVAAGYSGEELKTLVLEDMDFPKFADGHWGIAELIGHGGLHSGKYFLDWMRRLLGEKGITAFGDLRASEDDADPARRHRLQVIAADLSARRLLVLPKDAQQLGKDPDELDVAEAVRMSMSIPIFFTPWVEDDHTIVDGGVLSNFPVWLFDTAPGTVPAWPTFGLLLVAPDPEAAIPGGAQPELEGRLAGGKFLLALARTMMEAHDRLYIEQAQFARTIPIPTLGVHTTQFDIDPDAKHMLFQAGYEAATEFLRTWDFEAYKRTFRAPGPRTTRRERVIEQMHKARGEGA